MSNSCVSLQEGSAAAATASAVQLSQHQQQQHQQQQHQQQFSSLLYPGATAASWDWTTAAAAAAACAHPPGGGHRQHRQHQPQHQQQHQHQHQVVRNPFDAQSRIPLPHPFGEFMHFGCESSFIRRRNERERERVRFVNEGYEKLKETLPIENKDKRISKVEILKTAIRYIQHMEGLLRAADQQSLQAVTASASPQHLHHHHQHQQDRKRQHLHTQQQQLHTAGDSCTQQAGADAVAGHHGGKRRSAGTGAASGAAAAALLSHELQLESPDKKLRPC